jgi:hypothetical protein
MLVVVCTSQVPGRIDGDVWRCVGELPRLLPGCCDICGMSRRQPSIRRRDSASQTKREQDHKSAHLVSRLTLHRPLIHLPTRSPKVNRQGFRNRNKR